MKEIKLLAEKGKELNLGAKSIEKMKFTKIKKKEQQEVELKFLRG